MTAQEFGKALWGEFRDAFVWGVKMHFMLFYNPRQWWGEVKKEFTRH